MIPKIDEKKKKKLERLALIKERYRKIILEPRKEIEIELQKELGEDSLDFEDDFDNSFDADA